ncbi:hypothetical protein GIB67_034300 [Kingdonia uniflora]|uniref:Uncharacterized protein n=1 Tax=Kingdonia uniflora TaxID=39325 RepID=A0A7J7NSK7_9MAGN|nr:hypothetical protein GIB67_034300 [Kingdonia uniflora]
MNIRAHLHYASRIDRRRYNVPLIDEIAVILPGDGHEPCAMRDIVVYFKGQPINLHESVCPHLRVIVMRNGLIWGQVDDRRVIYEASLCGAAELRGSHDHEAGTSVSCDLEAEASIYFLRRRRVVRNLAYEGIILVCRIWSPENKGEGAGTSHKPIPLPRVSRACSRVHPKRRKTHTSAKVRIGVMLVGVTYKGSHLHWLGIQDKDCQSTHSYKSLKSVEMKPRFLTSKEKDSAGASQTRSQAPFEARIIVWVDFYTLIYFGHYGLAGKPLERSYADPLSLLEGERKAYWKYWFWYLILRDQVKTMPGRAVVLMTMALENVRESGVEGLGYGEREKPCPCCS